MNLPKDSFNIRKIKISTDFKVFLFCLYFLSLGLAAFPPELQNNSLGLVSKGTETLLSYFHLTPGFAVFSDHMKEDIVFRGFCLEVNDAGKDSKLNIYTHPSCHKQNFRFFTNSFDFNISRSILISTYNQNQIPESTIQMTGDFFCNTDLSKINKISSISLRYSALFELKNDPTHEIKSIILKDIIWSCDVTKYPSIENKSIYEPL